jgi:thioredoxin
MIEKTYDTPIPVSDETFQKEVLGSDLPVLVDFWAPWCGPCRMIAPHLERLAKEYAGKLRIAKLNVDEAPEYVQKYNIQGIPTLVLIKNGRPVDRLIGVPMNPYPMLKQLVSRAVLRNA